MDSDDKNTVDLKNRINYLENKIIELQRDISSLRRDIKSSQRSHSSLNYGSPDTKNYLSRGYENSYSSNYDKW